MNLQITKALDAHAQWKEKLSIAIGTGSLDKSVDEIKSDHHCAFGLWLFGSEFPEHLKETEHYKRVVQLHKNFHLIAARVAEQAVAGNKEVALNLLSEAEYTSATMNLGSALYYLDKLMQ